MMSHLTQFPRKGVKTVTVCERLTSLRVGTWNVRTMNEEGKLDNIKEEMKRLEINILGMCETRWTGSGVIKTDNYTIIHSGGENHQRGVAIVLDIDRSRCLKGYWTVSDRVLLVKLGGRPLDVNIIQVYAPTAESDEDSIETFYNDLDNALNTCRGSDINIILGDFNAKVGNQQDGFTVGKYGLGERNERGSRLVEWAKENDMIFGNTWFQQHPRRLWTWRSPDKKTKNQIDYILINRRFRNALKGSKTVAKADCNTDHRLVISKISLKLKKIKYKPKNIKLNLTSLKNDNEIKDRYNIEIKNRFDTLSDLEILFQDANEQWEQLKSSVRQAAVSNIPKMEMIGKKKWMTEEILKLMETRRNNIHDQEKYEELHRQIRKLCTEAKESWLNEKCSEIEEQYNIHNTKLLHARIKDLHNKRTITSTGCLKTKEGKIIMGKDEILNTWSEYVKELYNDTRDEQFKITYNSEGPPILNMEIQNALKHMKSGKTPGPDDITAEMISALEEVGINQLTRLLNTIYDTGDIPTDLCKSTFIAIPKKQGALECEQHRTISLMSHVTKILLRIITQRIRKKIKPEIGEEQCGFVEGKSTTNAIYLLRTIIERSLEVNKDVYLCFIDYTKAFDRVRHEDMIKMLADLQIDGKDLRIIKNIYWKQQAAIVIDNEVGKYHPIKRGVRQGCVMSPDLFSLYSENIMRSIEDKKGIKIGGHYINNVRYADDTVLIAENECDLQNLVDAVIAHSEQFGLELNCKKTEVMVVSKKKDNPQCNIQVNKESIKQVNRYNYLGTIITSDGRCLTEIRTRIAIAKEAFFKIKNILTNKKLSIAVRKKVLKCYVEPVLLYACETWTINKDAEKHLMATEMWFLRRMQRIPWTDRKTNEEVLQETEESRKLLREIRRRQSRFFGHVMRRNRIENLVTTGKLEGQRATGRPRSKYLDGLTEWHGRDRNTDLIHDSVDRVGWRIMTAHAYRHGT